LTARALAKRMRVSETTMSMTLRLLNLSAAALECILSNLDHRAIRHLGLRFLGKLTTASPAAQQTAITAVLERWAERPI
jgi:hypothetical protein